MYPIESQRWSSRQVWKKTWWQKGLNLLCKRKLKVGSRNCSLRTETKSSVNITLKKKQTKTTKYARNCLNYLKPPHKAYCCLTRGIQGKSVFHVEQHQTCRTKCKMTMMIPGYLNKKLQSVYKKPAQKYFCNKSTSTTVMIRESF